MSDNYWDTGGDGSGFSWGGGTPAQTTPARGVADVYKSVLNRDADAGGLSYWTNLFGDNVDDNELAQFKSSAQGELDGRPAWMQELYKQGNLNMSSSYTDPTTGKIYQPRFIQNGSGADMTWKQDGWLSGEGTKYAEGNKSPVSVYDMAGKQTNQFTNDPNAGLSNQQFLMLVAAAMAGGAGLETALGSGATGTMNSLPLMDTSLANVGTLPTVEGLSGLSGVDSAMIDLASSTPAFTGPPALSTSAASAASGTFNPAMDSQLANEVLNIPPNVDPVSPAIPYGQGGYPPAVGNPTGTNTIPDYPSTPTTPAADTPKPPTVPPVPKVPGDTKTKLPTGLEDITKIITGLLDSSKQNKAADDMLAWLKERTAITDNLYKPGSDEYNALWDQMSRKDAAAGRNSQYGPRSVDLASRVAQIKADQNTRMTTGIGQWMQGSFNQQASSNAGLMAMLGSLLGGAGGGSGGTGLIDTLLKMYGGSSSSDSGSSGGYPIDESDTTDVMPKE